MKVQRNRGRAAVLLAGLVVCPLGIGEAADAFNVDLGVYLGSPADTYGAASGQTGMWNCPGMGLTNNIANTSGTPTPVSIDVGGMSVDGWGGQNCSGEVDKLIRDHLFACYNSWSVAFSGLQNGLYTVYIYSANEVTRPLGNIVLNGVSYGQLPGVSSCDLVVLQTYLAPSVEVTDHTITIVGEYVASGTDCIGVGGLQIVPALFADGFESGNTSAWSSSTMPP